MADWLLDPAQLVNAVTKGIYRKAVAAHGNEEVVRLLLDKEVDFHAQSGYYRNALEAAA